MAKKTLSYEEMIAQTEHILQRIQSEEVPVEELAAEVKRATELIAACRKTLQKAEEEVNKIVEE